MNTAEQIRTFMGNKIRNILENPSDSAARAAMARLRRGIGHVPGDLPDLWGDFLLDMPEEFMGRGLQITAEEWAIYTALTLFAYHQQGNSRENAPMHQPGISLGTAANRLIQNEGEDRDRIARHFYPIATSTDMTEFNYHLRTLVSLLRSNEIAMDYVKLAVDVYFFQNPIVTDSIKLRWGEDFCRIHTKTNE